MLSYRHAFHAGNFADLLKHLILVQLLDHLQKKEGGIFYLETHAGGGLYGLHGAEAQKNREYADGIGRLWEVPDAPNPVRRYLEPVRACNPPGRLDFYPGSPLFAHYRLRPQDRMLLCDLHPAELPRLRQGFAEDPRVRVEEQDGYHALKAHLPPKDRRLLCLIDPSYEVREEYRRVLNSVQEAHRRCGAGVYAVWYPLLAKRELRQMLDGIQRSGIRKVLRAELWVRPPGPGMYGAGLLLVNPPWNLLETLQSTLPWLAARLDQGGAGWVAEWLVAE
jgi:23S rRNA (adenine2030-N6)-methyltransferase